MKIEGEIIATLEHARAAILANMDAHNINASGRTARAIVVRKTADGVQLVRLGGNVAPIDTLEIGRPGGNVPGGFRTTKTGVRDVSNTFKAILIKWAEEKGIAGFGWGQATMLGRRIAAQGTLRHQSPVDVWSTPVNQAKQRVQDIIRMQFLAAISKVVRTNF